MPDTPNGVADVYPPDGLVSSPRYDLFLAGVYAYQPKQRRSATTLILIDNHAGC